MTAKKKIQWDRKVFPHQLSDQPLTERQLIRLHNWRLFSEMHGGIYTARIAADALRMTTQGVWKAAQRGWIAFTRDGRQLFYSKKDVENYRWTISRKFKDSRPLPASAPKEFMLYELRQKQ